MSLTPEIERLVERGALFVANHSGGKDSSVNGDRQPLSP